MIHPCFYQDFPSFSFIAPRSRVPEELTKSTLEEGNSSGKPRRGSWSARVSGKLRVLSRVQKWPALAWVSLLPSQQPPKNMFRFPFCCRGCVLPAGSVEANTPCHMLEAAVGGLKRVRGPDPPQGALDRRRSDLSRFLCLLSGAIWRPL